jgi:small subunit ribosomal protein S8
MSMTDPIADLLTRIRNGQAAGKVEVSVQSSRVKEAIVRVLKEEGYVADFVVSKDGERKALVVALKYHAGKPVIERLERVSRPGLRNYRGKDGLPKVLGGLGVAIAPLLARAAGSRDQLGADRRRRSALSSPRKSTCRESQCQSTSQGVNATIAAGTVTVKGAKGAHASARRRPQVPEGEEAAGRLQ